MAVSASKISPAEDPSRLLLNSFAAFIALAAIKYTGSQRAAPAMTSSAVDGVSLLQVLKCRRA
jgi:hypothetical protein